MIILNERKFAESEDEFIESLFHPGGTCTGYAKRYKRQIKLFNMRKELIGVINKFGALLHASKLEGEKYWYSFMNIELLGDYSYAQKTKDVENLVKNKSFIKGETIYCFV